MQLLPHAALANWTIIFPAFQRGHQASKPSSFQPLDGTSTHFLVTFMQPGLVVLRGHSWVWANCSRNILVPWMIAGQRSKPHPCKGSHQTIKWQNNLLKSQQQLISHTLVHEMFVRHDNKQAVSQRARAFGSDKLNNIPLNPEAIIIQTKRTNQHVHWIRHML